MSDSTKTAPGTVSGTTGSGTSNWLSETYSDSTSAHLVADLASSDDAYVITEVSSSAASHLLKCTDWGFAIPASSTIIGIAAEIEIYADSAGSYYVTSAMSIVKAGSATGTAKGAGETISQTSSNTDTFGGSTDMWGATLTASDINNSGFGIQLRVSDSGFATNVRVDNIRLTVYYSSSSSFMVMF